MTDIDRIDSLLREHAHIGELVAGHNYLIVTSQMAMPEAQAKSLVNILREKFSVNVVVLGVRELPVQLYDVTLPKASGSVSEDG